ncbi:MAG: GNAT family N-acetyltransferase [Bacteroidales bacterium]|nr:GNAT family N-acetyltransferase [Bacteroidales bacterium]
MHIETLIKASEKDLREITEVVAQLSNNAQQLTLSHLREILSRAESRIFVARDSSGSIVGTLFVAWYCGLTSNKMWIEDVVVDKGSRGQGIGRSLVTAALDAAKEAGFKGKIMLTSRPTRVEAHALYKSLGFEEYDTGVFVIRIQ